MKAPEEEEESAMDGGRGTSSSQLDPGDSCSLWTETRTKLLDQIQ